MWFFILIFFNLLQLAAIKLGRYGEDLLFYLYYMNGGDVLQLLAAVELYVQTILSVLYELIYCNNEMADVKKKKPKENTEHPNKLNIESKSLTVNLFLKYLLQRCCHFVQSFFYICVVEIKSPSHVFCIMKHCGKNGRCQSLLNV